jgi:uncharacterized protein with von Willebrand factor type A (vWA) domain
LAISIVSCSLVKTAYNNAPEAMHWWLDDYFDFTESQNATLKPALHALHDWHRQTQLPLYVEMLQKIQNDLSKETIEPSTVCESMNTMQDFMQNLQLESSSTIIEIAPLLSDKQLSYFQKKLQKRTLKWKSEWLQETREEQIEARFERTIDYAEKVYGNLSKPQKNMLKQKLLASNYKAEITYTEVLRRNEDALQIVTSLKRENLDQEQKQTLVKQGFDRLRNSPNPVYENYANQVKQSSCEMIADLHATTDVKQKQHAKAWLDNFITSFKSLALNKP